MSLPRRCLLAVLAFGATPAFAEGAAIPAPPECPWQRTSWEELGPSANVASNGSAWAKVHQRTPLEWTLVHQQTGDIVDLLSETTSTAAPSILPGHLLRLRPAAPLREGQDYLLRVKEPGGERLVSAWRAGARDDQAPATPVIQGSGPISNAYELCATAGVVLDFQHEGGALILAEGAQDGALLAVAHAEARRIFVPTEAGAAVEVTLVAMDYAGNRSAKTAPETVQAGAVAQVQGREYNFDCPGPSCGCGQVECLAGSAPSASMLLLLLTLRARRRR